MEINGKKIAENILNNLFERVKKLKEKKVVPHLAIILVGNDPASKEYVRQKTIKAEKIGAKVTLYNFSVNVSLQKLLLLINKLNHNSLVHGIIVQRPLPLHIDSNKIALAVDPKKDIDAFHPDSKFSVPIACAVLKILKEVYLQVKHRVSTPGVGSEEFVNWLKKQNIAVIGKGETGGKLVIEMFKKMRIEPKVIDSKTKNPEKLTKNADIIISAVGKLNIVKPEMIKKNSVLISIGLHKENGKLHGDYDEEKIKNVVSFYTPTPGGVGPVNVACLLENLIMSTEKLTA